MVGSTFTLYIKKLFWLIEDRPEVDLCAHALLKIMIGNEIIADDNDDSGGWTVSASALFFLRTLKRNHTTTNPLCDALIPCCGHFMIFQEDMNEVIIPNCLNGFDWEVVHQQDKVVLRTRKNTVKIDFEVYKQTVLHFVDQVEFFYQSSAPKLLPDEEYEVTAYQKFWEEWYRLRNEWR